MINKKKLMDYLEENFTIDPVAYGLIYDLCDTYKDDVNSFINILNNNRIDITLNELKDNNIYKSKSEFILDKKYPYIVARLNNIFNLFNVDSNIIDKKLNDSEVLQVDFDDCLLDLIDVIEEGVNNE